MSRLFGKNPQELLVLALVAAPGTIDGRPKRKRDEDGVQGGYSFLRPPRF